MIEQFSKNVVGHTSLKKDTSHHYKLGNDAPDFKSNFTATHGNTADIVVKDKIHNEHVKNPSSKAHFVLGREKSQ